MLALLLFLSVNSCLSSNTSSILSSFESKCADKTDNRLKGNGLFKNGKREFVRNQLLVKFKPRADPEIIDKITDKLGLKIIKKVSRPHVYLMEIIRNGTVEEVMKRLREYEQVEYCEPNYVYKIQSRERKK